MPVARPRARAGRRAGCSGPGDGAALHFPLRAAVWESYRRGDLPSWNPAIFLGTPLLAAYRPGALLPADGGCWPPCRRSPPSRCSCSCRWPRRGPLVFLYLRRLGGGAGGRVRGRARASRWGRTSSATSATPRPWWRRRSCRCCSSPRSRHVNRGTAGARRGPRRGARPGRCSPARRRRRAPRPRSSSGGSLVAPPAAGRRARRGRWRASSRWRPGSLLAAPQLAAHAPRRARRRPRGDRPRLAGHPAARASSASSCATRRTPRRPRWPWPRCPWPSPRRRCASSASRSLICLALQWGRGPLAARGRPGLVFDLTLCVLAGLSLSAQWRARREPRGRAPARLLPRRLAGLRGRAVGGRRRARAAAGDAGRRGGRARAQPHPVLLARHLAARAARAASGCCP